MEGACDLHIHTGPDRFPRYIDDVDAARLARDHSMEAIMFKCHHESTASRAIHTERQVPGIRVFGGIVLNWFVGGISPDSVGAALEAGAKQVWMPTYHSEYHRQTFGSVGSYGLKSMDSSEREKDVSRGITVLDEKGELIDEAKQIIELVSEHEAILASAHLSPPEVKKVLEFACRKSTKVLITHPFFKLPNLGLNELRELTDMGGIAELVAVDHFNLPTEHHPTVHRSYEAIQDIGAEKFILSSDAGQPFNPNPVEAIRVVAESLFELGISKDDLRQIMVSNPAMLLGL